MSETGFAIEGYIDDWDGRTIKGWAWEPSSLGVPLTLEMVAVDGAVLATAGANGFRGDLASAGKRGGWCAFSIAVPAGSREGEVRLRARRDDATRDVPGGVFHYRPPASERDEGSSDLMLSDGAGIIGQIEFVGAEIGGWVHGPTPFEAPLELELVDAGVVIARGTADRWRKELVDLRQGDGRAGFSLVAPPSLFDGETHRLELRPSGGTNSLLATPLELKLQGEPLQRGEPHIDRPSSDTPIELTIVVNFYNMHREAERTLTSLSRRFQRDIGNLAYEVICIDNGSAPPMTEESITKHGPEFRLFTPSRAHPSPVFAINEAAASARGRWIAVVIDGAHLLSPGVLAEAVAALRSRAGAVVAVRHWFIGGDQRWISEIGYTGALEDIAFAKIGWPNCGYDIFEIAAPIFESPNHWFDSMSESNCLFLSADAFAALGGYDPAFETPGAGLANLDLFTRAARAPGATVVALVGEASFHQFHGGTTTNVTDAEKETRVRRYYAEYERIRGFSFMPVGAFDIVLQGRIRSSWALTARQRVNSSLNLGLTDAVRPGQLHYQFDQGARQYARSVYVECGMHDRSIWAGKPTGVAPADLLEIQQMLFDTRPEVLVLRDVDPGLLAFVQSILTGIGLDALRLVCVSAVREQVPQGVIGIVGNAMDNSVVAAIEDALGVAERICALVEPKGATLAELERYSSLISPGGYLVVLNAAKGQPDLGYARQWTSALIERFVRSDTRFVVDRTMNAHLISTCPSGFLKRRPYDRDDYDYDPALDELEDA